MVSGNGAYTDLRGIAPGVIVEMVALPGFGAAEEVLAVELPNAALSVIAIEQTHLVVTALPGGSHPVVVCVVAIAGCYPLRIGRGVQQALGGIVGRSRGVPARVRGRDLEINQGTVVRLKYLNQQEVMFVFTQSKNRPLIGLDFLFADCVYLLIDRYLLIR